MLPARRPIVALLVVCAAALASATVAHAELVVKQDAAGRSINFDVLAPDVNVDWYAGLISNAAHGDEVSAVTIRVVPQSEIRAACGAGAAACYQRRRATPTITVPAGEETERLAATVLHEYGHHLDANRPVSGVDELNGTPTWWAMRGMAALLAAGTVREDYLNGWDHSIGEIFAEDYSAINMGSSRYYSIPWLAPPDDALKAALLAELGGATVPPASPAPAPATRPVTVSKAGTLAARGRSGIPFGLLGPGRHVTWTATVTPLVRKQVARGRIQVVCAGSVVGSKPIVSGRSVTIDLANLGPASCEASVISTSAARERYTAKLRLAIESATTAR
jgi:hypothetical protein